MAKFLDKAGVTTLWNKVKDFVRDNTVVYPLKIEMYSDPNQEGYYNVDDINNLWNNIHNILNNTTQLSSKDKLINIELVIHNTQTDRTKGIKGIARAVRYNPDTPSAILYIHSITPALLTRIRLEIAPTQLYLSKEENIYNFVQALSINGKIITELPSNIPEDVTIPTTDIPLADKHNHGIMSMEDKIAIEMCSIELKPILEDISNTNIFSISDGIENTDDIGKVAKIYSALNDILLNKKSLSTICFNTQVQTSYYDCRVRIIPTSLFLWRKDETDNIYNFNISSITNIGGYIFLVNGVMIMDVTTLDYIKVDINFTKFNNN